MQNGRCRKHGGATPHGIASPHFKTGLYSAYMPQLLRERHEERMANMAEIKRMDADISLATQRVEDLLQRLETGERGTCWDDIQEIVADVDGGYLSASDAMPRLRDVAAKGKTTEQAWRDLSAAWNDRAKLIGMEAKRMADMGEIATKDEVKTLVIQIVAVVRDHVKDDATLRAISGDLTHILQGDAKRRSASILS